MNENKLIRPIIFACIILIIPIVIYFYIKCEDTDFKFSYMLFYSTVVPLIVLYFSLLHNKIENNKKEAMDKKRYLLTRLSESKIFCSSLTKAENANVMCKDKIKEGDSSLISQSDKISIKGFSKLDHTDINLFEMLIAEFLLIFDNNIDEDLKCKLNEILNDRKMFYYIMYFDTSKIANYVTLDNGENIESHFYVSSKVLNIMANKLFLKRIPCKGVEVINVLDGKFNYSEMSFYDILDKYRDGLEIKNIFKDTIINTSEYRFITNYVEKNNLVDEFDDLIKGYDIKISKECVTFDEFREFTRYHDYYKKADVKCNIELYVNYNDRGFFPKETRDVIVYNESMCKLVNEVRDFLLS